MVGTNPRSKFVEVAKVGHWTVGRKSNGYGTLYSAELIVWVTEGDYANKGIIADGTQNIWACELGLQVDYGSFENVIEKVTTSTIDIRGTEDSIEYFSHLGFCSSK